ncbi:MAG: hypothetical protein D9V47_13815 [Clostridia bacterium]|nr:MAG: hypothetical protein D9V47_13815 [Clostridia bacterium]
MDYRRAVEGFLTDLRLSGKSAKTVKDYAYALEKYGAWLTENNVDYLAVNGKETKGFRNYLASHLKPASVNLILSVLSSFYAYLVEEGQLKGNPVQVKKLRVKQEEERVAYLSDEDVGKVLAYFENKPPHVRLAFHVMLYAGLRIGEVARLTRSNVVVHTGRVFLEVSGKGGKVRTAPVTDRQCAKELVQWATGLPEGQPLFASYANLEYHARECRKATGVKFHPHRCRHTFGTNLLRQGHSLDVIQEAMGHASITTTRRYAKTLPEKLFRLAASC